MKASPRKYFSGLSGNTFLLALASLFSDISSEMLYPVLPMFLTQTLGSRASIVGVVEGVAPAIQNITQGLSGYLSDKLGRRKPLALVGYALSAISKPLIGLSTSWVGVLGARSLDRLGAGTRSAPRDALVAASTDAAHRGKAFGLEGAGDNLGAFVGPLIAIALLSLLGLKLRSIFLLALIPGVLAMLMVLLVRERPVDITAKSKLDLNFRRFPKAYWMYLLATAIFGFGNSSNSFLILRTQSLGVSLTTTIFIYALFNLVAALASYPAGYLSDLLGRRGVLLLGFIAFVIVYSGFGFATHMIVIAPLFLLYGLYEGIFRAVGKALATDFLPAELHASGIGWFSTVVGMSGLIASLVGGQLWDRVSPQSTFLYGAIFALLGSVALIVLVPSKAAPRS